MKTFAKKSSSIYLRRIKGKKSPNVQIFPVDLQRLGSTKVTVVEIDLAGVSRGPSVSWCKELPQGVAGRSKGEESRVPMMRSPTTVTHHS